MSLTKVQVQELEDSINSYSFPLVYYDFDKQSKMVEKSMRCLEDRFRGMLNSNHNDQLRDGLANVVYWGNANAGYQMYRMQNFVNRVSVDHLEKFKVLIQAGEVPTLKEIGKIKMPQFSGVSFVSKVVAFLDPVNYCVLDLLLSKLSSAGSGNAISRLVVGNQIRITAVNCKAYTEWCGECAAINNEYYDGRYRVVDIERGFFNLVQKGDLTQAMELYRSACI